MACGIFLSLNVFDLSRPVFLPLDLGSSLDIATFLFLDFSLELVGPLFPRATPSDPEYWSSPGEQEAENLRLVSMCVGVPIFITVMSLFVKAVFKMAISSKLVEPSEGICREI